MMEIHSRTTIDRAYTPRRLHATAAAAIVLQIACAVPSQAYADPAARCGRAIIGARNRVAATDVRLLVRCARNIAEGRSQQAIEDTCSKLRTSALGADLADRSARARIERRCHASRPVWVPAHCVGPGPQLGRSLGDATAIADCVTSSGHCLALTALDSLLGDRRAEIAAQHPANLSFELGGIPGNGFDACGNTPLTTTTTLPTATSTTTTTLDPVTTTSTSTTTLVPAPLALVITEVMSNPAAQSDAAGEYFEVWNAGNQAVDLQGTTVRDEGSNSFTIADPLIVAPGAYAVLARSVSAADGAVDYVYGSAMALSNGGDAIIIERGGSILDALVYDSAFPLADGRAMELLAGAHDAGANDVAENWCSGSAALADGDFGSPGAPPSPCMP